jgi:hypothetical protein
VAVGVEDIVAAADEFVGREAFCAFDSSYEVLADDDGGSEFRL